jgi:hypothetical protein
MEGVILLLGVVVGVSGLAVQGAVTFLRGIR